MTKDEIIQQQADIAEREERLRRATAALHLPPASKAALLEGLTAVSNALAESCSDDALLTVTVDGRGDITVLANGKSTGGWLKSYSPRYSAGQDAGAAFDTAMGWLRLPTPRPGGR